MEDVKNILRGSHFCVFTSGTVLNVRAYFNTCDTNHIYTDACVRILNDHIGCTTLKTIFSNNHSSQLSRVPEIFKNLITANLTEMYESSHFMHLFICVHIDSYSMMYDCMELTVLYSPD